MQIALEHIGFRFSSSGRWLFRDINYIFAPGSITAITGPSGSGKSTLLDLIGVLLKPSEGKVHAYDSPRDDSSPEPNKYFSWVLQSNTVLLGRSASENVAISLIARGGRQQESMIAATRALEMLGLSSRVSAPVDELSGGEIQRVTIARCLLSNASVILADEPTGQLDRENSIGIVRALKLAADSGKTVIVATHDPVVASNCDAIVEIERY